jgi:hypothetical protein
MPTWAASIITSAVIGVAAFLIRYLMSSSRVLGKVEQAFIDTGRRLLLVEEWQKDRDAELVAYRNGYRQRPW